MLDVMRKHSRSFIIYVLFGIIIAVFVINFGPQSQGCTAKSSYAGKIQGKTISHKVFGYAQSVSGIRNSQASEPQMVRLRGMVMDQLIVRELLADDALNLGIRIPEKEINDMLVKGRFLALGKAQAMIRNDDGEFDYDLFSRFVRYSWGMTVKSFKEEQRRELLAEKYRELLRSSVKVSEDEVKSEFSHINTKVQLSYVRFPPGDFRSQVDLSEDKIKAFLDKNKDEIKKHYEENKTAYQKLPKQIRLQWIKIQVLPPKAKPKARQRALTALKRLKAGEPFAKVAQDASDDAFSRENGGDLGWRNEVSPGIGVNATKKLKKMKKGDLSEVIEETDGFNIVKVLDRREGDLKLEQVQLDIAEELLKKKETLRLARQKAEGSLKRIKAGEKLTDLFEDPTATAEEKEEGEEAGEDKPKKAAKKKAAEDNKKPSSEYKLATTAMFTRSSRNLVPGIGISEEVMNRIFEMKKGQVHDRPFVVGDIVYLIAIKDREDPDWKEWPNKKDELIEQAIVKKVTDIGQGYILQRCQAALNDKELRINHQVLVTPGYVPQKDDEPLPAYTPCESLKVAMGPTYKPPLDLQGQPGMPGMPGMPQPGMPRMPGMPQPGMPGMPGMPQPGRPGMPGMPGMPPPGMPAMPPPGMPKPGMPSSKIPLPIKPAPVKPAPVKVPPAKPAPARPAPAKPAPGGPK